MVNSVKPDSGGGRIQQDRPAAAVGSAGLGGRIRPTTLADTAAIALLEPLIFGDDAWSPQLVESELAAPYRSYFTLEIAGEVAGYAGLFVAGSEADVQTIAVAAEQRGRGWGKKLFVALLAEAERQRVKQLFLEVRADNPAAIGLYSAFGFAEIAIRPNYYQPSGVDALIMRADLRSPKTTNPLRAAESAASENEES